MKWSIILFSLFWIHKAEANFCFVACNPINPQIIGWQPYTAYAPIYGYTYGGGNGFSGYGGFQGYGNSPGYGSFPGYGYNGFPGYSASPGYGSYPGYRSSPGGGLLGIQGFPGINHTTALRSPRYSSDSFYSGRNVPIRGSGPTGGGVSESPPSRPPAPPTPVEPEPVVVSPVPEPPPFSDPEPLPVEPPPPPPPVVAAPPRAPVAPPPEDRVCEKNEVIANCICLPPLKNINGKCAEEAPFEFESQQPSSILKCATKNWLRTNTKSQSACDSLAVNIRKKHKKEKYFLPVSPILRKDGVCVIPYQDKECEPKAVPPPPPPKPPRLRIEPETKPIAATPDFIVDDLPRPKIPEPPPKIPDVPVTPAQPVGCEPGYVLVQASAKGVEECLPCNEEGMIIKSGKCDCIAEYGIETIGGTGVGIKCKKIPIESEGAALVCPGGPNCPTVDKCKNPQMQDLAFNCDCIEGTDLYPSENETVQNIMASMAVSDGNSEMISKCIYHYMKQSYNSDLKTGKGNFVYCKNNVRDTKISNPPCFTPQYHAIATASFENATKCLQIDPNELLPLLGQESTFHVNILSSFDNDPSVGYGQLKFGTLGAAMDLASGPTLNSPDCPKDKKDKCRGRHGTYLSLVDELGKDESCKKRMKENLQEFSKSIKDIKNKNYCAAVEPGDNPEKSAYLSAIYYSYMKQIVTEELKERGITLENKQIAALTSIAYNQGEGAINTLLDSYKDIKDNNRASYRNKRLDTTNKDKHFDYNNNGLFWQIADIFYDTSASAGNVPKNHFSKALYRVQQLEKNNNLKCSIY